MKNIRLTIQYDGTNYHGWQRQKNTHRTIQEIIENRLEKILREKVRLTAAGRTDAGVHAFGQVANFKTKSPLAAPKLAQSLNGLLPEDIRITSARPVSLVFHSRYHVKEKTYRYNILNRPSNDVFLRRFVCHYPSPVLDIKAMRQAAQILVGRHDFSSFRISTQTKNNNNLRQIKKIRVSAKGNLITIEVTGRGFLHKMVRGIVGTLIEIGRKKLSVSAMPKILRAKNRKAAGPTARACGLCLVKVKY